MDDEDSEGQGPKTTKKSEKVCESKHATRVKKLKISDEEGYSSDTSAFAVKSTKKKGKRKTFPRRRKLKKRVRMS